MQILKTCLPVLDSSVNVWPRVSMHCCGIWQLQSHSLPTLLSFKSLLLQVPLHRSWHNIKSWDMSFSGKMIKVPERGFTVLLSFRVYECNKRCKCNINMCTNRLVQHGLQVRLQLFKTQNKGWGIRCLDDIAKGSFVCIYAGRISPR